MTGEDPNRYIPSLESFIQSIPERELKGAVLAFNPEQTAKPLGIEINSSVNYLARSWKLGRLTPASAGQFYLLSRNLSTGFLWDKVRVEGGAYGGMALTSSSHPDFACASYRDPNLSRTLENFTAGLKTVAESVTDEEVDQSVIGAIGRLDQPRSPHGKGLGETIALLCGRTEAIRQQIRDAVLHSTAATLKEKASQILDIKESAVTIFGSSSAFDEADETGAQFGYVGGRLGQAHPVGAMMLAP